MFQADLGRMVREEQYKDYLREAKQAKRTSPDSRERGLRRWIALPLFLMTVLTRLMETYPHTIRH